MNYIFCFFIIVSIILGALNGKLDDVVNSILTGADLSVKIALSLIGIISFWLGIMRIAEKSGLIKILARIIRPAANMLFDEVPSGNPAIGNITLSLSANALGLTNAATPIGLRVMQELQDINKDKSSASNAMCMFLAMNTAGFQIIPASVIAILAACGSNNPAEIIAPALIVTTISFTSAILIAKLFQKIWKPQRDEGGEA